MGWSLPVSLSWAGSPVLAKLVWVALPLLLGTFRPARGADRSWVTVEDRDEIVAPDPVLLRVPLGVAWQMTASRLLASGTTTVSQSYRETWTLEMARTGGSHLVSPRGRRPIYVAGERHSRFEMPKTFIISEQDLAALVGLGSSATGGFGEEAESAARVLQVPILVNLARPARGGIDLSVSWSDDEHYDLHLDVGGIPVP